MEHILLCIRRVLLCILFDPLSKKVHFLQTLRYLTQPNAA